MKEETEKFDEVIVNPSRGDKQLGCCNNAAIFINGLKTIIIDEGKPVLLSIIKLSYSEAISEAKIKILRAMERAGGSVKSLTHLSELTDYGKPLLSYHINGDEKTKGLLQLGLISIVRKEGKRRPITLTDIGRIFLAGL
ncbi:MAG: hypothetical protein QXX95_07915 [Nitrososphaerales archaeon]